MRIRGDAWVFGVTESEECPSHIIRTSRGGKNNDAPTRESFPKVELTRRKKGAEPGRKAHLYREGGGGGISSPFTSA